MISGNYRSFKDYYQAYRQGHNSQHKRNRVYAFFMALINYVFRKPKPVSLSEEEKERFERGLDRDITSKFDVHFTPGEIVLRPKSLSRRLS